MGYMNNLVYALLDPDTKEVRYIGKSSKGLYRPSRHLKPYMYNSSNSYKNCWIRSLVKCNKLPIIHVLSYHTNENEAYCAEIDYIKLYKHLGAKLTNYTEGGRAGEGGKPSIATRRKMSLAHKGKNNSFYGKTHTPETIEKIKKANLGRKLPKRVKRKMSLSKKGKPQSQELIRKRAESKKKSIVAIDRHTGVEVVFKSATDACMFGFSQAGISKAISTGKFYYNFYWKRQ